MSSITRYDNIPPLIKRRNTYQIYAELCEWIYTNSHLFQIPRDLCFPIEDRITWMTVYEPLVERPGYYRSVEKLKPVTIYLLPRSALSKGVYLIPYCLPVVLEKEIISYLSVQDFYGDRYKLWLNLYMRNFTQFSRYKIWAKNNMDSLHTEFGKMLST